MPPILPAQLSRRPQVIFSDFDDTLTWHGELPECALQALYQLRAQHILVVIVTGACAGWCDFLLRTMPVAAVIGEGGSFWFADAAKLEQFAATGVMATGIKNVSRHFVVDAPTRRAQRRALEDIGSALKQAIPALHYARDQDFRLTDLAFDIAQEHKVAADVIQAALDFLHQHGVHAKQSSIHINAWLGDYHKASTALALLKKLKIAPENAMAVGDSLNDESLFAAFETSVAVANAAPILAQLRHPPRYLCRQNGGFGFAELAAAILASPSI